jgi:hypothetical protein
MFRVTTETVQRDHQGSLLVQVVGHLEQIVTESGLKTSVEGFAHLSILATADHVTRPVSPKYLGVTARTRILRHAGWS